MTPSFGFHVLNVGIVTAALSLPPVTRATGIPAVTVVAIILVHLVWTGLVFTVLRPTPSATALRFHLALGGSIAINALIVVAFPALGTDPRTPLWMLPVMYACFNGSMQETEPSIGVLLIHVGVPLLAIPLLLARGHDHRWSIAAPLLCSVVSAVGYNHLAAMSARWRDERHEREAELAALRANLDEVSRAHLARELHDTLGSSLAIVGLYGDLIERNADRPGELRAIAAIVRGAADEGTSELAALFETIVPASADVDGVVATVIESGRRASLASGTLIDVRVVRGGDARLEGAVRLALVRVFQESLHNALEHGAARRVAVEFTADDRAVSIEVSDDGIGFAPAEVCAGRGLSGMRARAAELGGTFALSSSAGAGARIRVTLPRSVTA